MVRTDLTAVFGALLAVGALMLVMRWVFAPSRPRPSRRAQRRGAGNDAVGAQGPDLGLLTPIAVGVSRGTANALRATLGDAGIRSSLSARRDGLADVMVFRADVDRARPLLPPGI